MPAAVSSTMFAISVISSISVISVISSISSSTCAIAAAAITLALTGCFPGPTPAHAAAPLPALAPLPAPVAAPALEPAAPALVIVERPIVYDERRKQRTIAYRRRHEDPAAATHVIDPRIIVVHHTGGGRLDATWRYFNRGTSERARTTVARAGELGLSAHFLVERDGKVVRLVPETWMARHVVGLNHLAIGVENVGDGDRFPLTDAQRAANIALIRDLRARFPGLTHLIGHHEYRAFEGHPYFKELEADHRTQRNDPGPAFMQAVRADLTDLGLAGPPL